MILICFQLTIKSKRSLDFFWKSFKSKLNFEQTLRTLCLKTKIWDINQQADRKTVFFNN